MDILIFTAQFLIGLTAIVKGADWLTDGSANVARRFGVSTFVVGMTIVAMGSSAPELVVSVVSALKGNVDISLGNVVGSNIFNILAIMGITVLVQPIKVNRGNLRYDVPFVVLSSIVIVITAFDSYFQTRPTANSISRTDGLLMLCMFAIFLSYTMSISHGITPPEAIEATDTDEDTPQKTSATKDVVLIIIGLALLIFGGDWLVTGASGIASALGVSEAIIALTIVSVGTSAPELAASVMAAKKGDTAMALGNIVGSCVFNVFFVLGIASSIHPLGVGGITEFDILTLLASSFMLWFFCRFGKTALTLTRSEGLMMTIAAVAYYVILVLKE